jgi:site-specific recombinase XerC
MTPLAPLVTAFFRQYLAVEKGVSKHTIASYSYAFKFLCGYVSGRLGKSPSQLALEDLDAPMVRDFLESGAGRREHGTDPESPLDRDSLLHEVRRVRGPLRPRAGPSDPRDRQQAH